MKLMTKAKAAAMIAMRDPRATKLSSVSTAAPTAEVVSRLRGPHPSRRSTDDVRRKWSGAFGNVSQVDGPATRYRGRSSFEGALSGALRGWRYLDGPALE